MLTIKELFEVFKQIGLSLAIAILFPITTHYGIQIVSPEPYFESTHKQELEELNRQNESLTKERESLLGPTVPVEIKTEKGAFKWEAHFIGGNVQKYDEITGKINANETRTEELNKLIKDEEKLWNDSMLYHYQMIYFLLAVFFGLIALLAGYWFTAGSVCFGLIFGGLFSIFWGYQHFWSNMSNVLKFGSLAITIVIITYVATVTYKRLHS